MILEHIGGLVDDFVIFYISSVRPLSLEEFLTNIAPDRIIIYMEFFNTKGITFHVYSDRVDINFTHGEYVLSTIPVNKQLTYAEQWYFVIIMTFKYLNKERVTF